MNPPPILGPWTATCCGGAGRSGVDAELGASGPAAAVPQAAMPQAAVPQANKPASRAGTRRMDMGADSRWRDTLDIRHSNATRWTRTPRSNAANLDLKLRPFGKCEGGNCYG